MCGAVEMTNFLLMLVAVGILVSVELWVFILVKGLHHHFWSGWFLAEFQVFCFSAAHRFLFCVLLAWVEVTVGTVTLAWNNCSVSYFYRQKENLLSKSSLLLMKMCIPTFWLRSEVVCVHRKILPFLSRDVDLLVLTKALYMQAFNLLQSFPPMCSPFEADEINPWSKVGTAAGPRWLFSLTEHLHPKN